MEFFEAFLYVVFEQIFLKTLSYPLQLIGWYFFDKKSEYPNFKEYHKETKISLGIAGIVIFIILLVLITTQF